MAHESAPTRAAGDAQRITVSIRSSDVDGKDTKFSRIGDFGSIIDGLEALIREARAHPDATVTLRQDAHNWLEYCGLQIDEEEPAIAAETLEAWIGDSTFASADGFVIATSPRTR